MTAPGPSLSRVPADTHLCPRHPLPALLLYAGNTLGALDCQPERPGSDDNSRITTLGSPLARRYSPEPCAALPTGMEAHTGPATEDVSPLPVLSGSQIQCPLAHASLARGPSRPIAGAASALHLLFYLSNYQCRRPQTPEYPRRTASKLISAAGTPTTHRCQCQWPLHPTRAQAQPPHWHSPPPASSLLPSPCRLSRTPAWTPRGAVQGHPCR